MPHTLPLPQDELRLVLRIPAQQICFLSGTAAAGVSLDFRGARSSVRRQR
jgi:hypothetical protein